MQAPDTQDATNRGQPTGSVRGYTPLQTLFLLRIRSLVGKRQQYAGRIDPGDWRIKLLDKALYSTYCDCADLGIGQECQTILRQARQAQSS